MTTGAMVLGAVPLAVATGAGAESRIQIGMVIVGGMTLGTLLTLFVVPTFYTLLTRGKVFGGAKAAAAKAEAEGGPQAGAPDAPEAPAGSPPSQRPSPAAGS
jgi:multidrug efflux pump